MIFVYGRDKMTDREKLSLRKHPDYPEIYFESKRDCKSGYQYYEALDPEIAVDAGLRKIFWEGCWPDKHFVKELVPVYKVVLA